MGQKWTEEEINLLKIITKNKKKFIEILECFPNRSRSSITSMIQRLNLKTICNWSEEEILYLKTNYSIITNKELSIKLNRTLGAINRMGGILKLKKDKIIHYQKLYKDNLKILLEENFISYYYIGYLLADANFTNGLSLEISNKDEEHLKNFLFFINYKNTISKRRNNCAVHISDKKNMDFLKSKFDISNNKSLNPPRLKFYKNLNRDLLLSLIIGFIDGDGCIRKTTTNQVQICIEIHNSWYDFLNLILEKINLIKKIKSKVRINSRGYACLTICGEEIFNYLNNFIDKNSLPILKRKWKHEN